MLLTPRESGTYFCDTPRPGDDADLRDLGALAMPGPVSLSLRAGPDRRHAERVQGERRSVVVVRRRDDARIVACGSRSVRRLWMNGTVRRVGYLTGLRKTPGVLVPRRLVAEAFDRLLSMRRADECDYDLTSIMRDNAPARRLLERGVPGLPRYARIGAMVTLTVPARAGATATPPLRRLGDADVPRVAELLGRQARRAHGRPHWTPEALRCPERCRGLDPGSFVGYEDGGRLVACGAVWDQRAFKQVVVGGVAPALARWRPLVNLACRCGGRVPLPRPGDGLSAVYASHLAVPDDRPEIWPILLRGLQCLAARRGAGAVVLGLPAPHRSVARRGAAWRSHSVIYTVRHGEPPALDGRPVWPEAAVL